MYRYFQRDLLFLCQNGYSNIGEKKCDYSYFSSLFQQDRVCFSRFCFLLFIKWRWEVRWTIAEIINQSCQTLREGGRPKLSHRFAANHHSGTKNLKKLLPKKILNGPIQWQKRSKYFGPKLFDPQLTRPKLFQTELSWSLRILRAFANSLYG